MSVRGMFYFTLNFARNLPPIYLAFDGVWRRAEAR